MTGTIRRRGRLLPWLGAIWIASAIIAYAWCGTSTGDYANDAGPAMSALLSGHLDTALSLQPMMGMLSLLLRAPFALIGHLGDSTNPLLAEYRWGSVPCIAAAGMLGLAAAERMRHAGSPPVARAAIVAICLVNPLTRAALAQGHPEELLGGALCAGAVLAAGGGRTLLAGALLGAAIGTKQWALLAIGPVLLAAPAGPGRRRLVAAGAVIALLLTVPLLARPAEFLAVQRAASHSSGLVSVYNIWRPLSHATPRSYSDGAQTRVAYGHETWPLVADGSHALILLLGLLLPIALALASRRRERPGGAADAALLLALLMLLRCMLDPLDNVYYHLPLLLALASWDGVAARRWPNAAAAGLAASWLVADWAPPHLSVDGFALLYCAVALAGLAVLGWRLARGQSMLSSSFGKALSTSWPSAVTQTRSSIRTPSLPGR